MPAPLLDQDLRLGERVEHLRAEQLVTQLAVEAFHVAVLPGAAGLDESRRRTDAADPALHGCGCELGPIVRTNMAWDAAQDEYVGQHVDDVRGSELAPNPDRQTFAGELADDVQHPEPAPVPGAVLDEVISPDGIGTLRPEPYAGAIVQPEPPALGLPGRHLQPLRPPDPLHLLVVAPPALSP